LFAYLMEIGACVAVGADEVSIVHADRAIGECAAGQDGLITWAQLRALGLGRGAIEHRVNRGLLRRVHIDVTVVGRRVRRSGIRVHRVDAVHRHDVSRLRGIWVSSPARALLEVDVLWRRERVVLEFDSYEFHATRAAFERDRRRTAALTRGRYVVLRTTWALALNGAAAASSEEIRRVDQAAR
jgi:very-short-patch-repair endonuclease